MAARHKIGRPRLEDRHKTFEATMPWLAKNMSRSTWYSRRRERREKRRAR
jgi:hypothetical protein